MATPRALPGYEGVSIGAYGAAAGGSGAVCGVSLSGWARQNTDERPYGVANDYIASTLGLMLGLPIAPVSLISLDGDIAASVSLGFGERGVAPPPADLEQLGQKYPEDVAGIVVFDQWVVNTDRHDENLASLAKHGMVAFDHDAALIGWKPKVSVSDSIAKGRGHIVSGHCLAPHVASWDHLSTWQEAVRRVPRWAIRRVVQQAFGAKLITAKERDELASLLVFRASQIGAMIENRAHEFTRITQVGLKGDEQS